MGKQSEGEVIFVKWFRHPKTRKVIRAADYGKKAFAIKVREKKSGNST